MTVSNHIHLTTELHRVIGRGQMYINVYTRSHCRICTQCDV